MSGQVLTMGYWLVPVIALVLALALTPLAGRLSVLCGAVDLPGDRKVHQQPMPRLGGLAVIAAVALALVTARFLEHPQWAVLASSGFAIAVGLLPIFLVSVVDDIRRVPARVKFICHLSGAVAAVVAGLSLPPDIRILGVPTHIGVWVAVPVSVLWLVGVTNAFNIVDGLDGLAAGLALISAATMSGVFLVVGQYGSALIPLALAGALLGFLPYNMYPARLFLGDTGATAIGFCLAAVALKGGSTLSAGFAAVLPVLLMGVPIADTLIAIGRRLIRRAEEQVGGVFQPDRNHVHHRLLALGVDHRKAVLILHAVGASVAIVAFVSIFLSSQRAALLLLALGVAGFIGVRRLGYDEFALVRRGTILRMYEAPVLKRSMFVVFVDLVLVTMAAYLAVALKTDDWGLVAARNTFLELLAFMAPASALAFWRAGLYRGSWKLASTHAYLRATLACAAVPALGIVFLSWQFHVVPASLLVVYALVSVLLVIGARVSYRVALEVHHRSDDEGTAALLCGPIPTDVMQAREMLQQARYHGLRPVGAVTPTPAKRGQLLAGLEILGEVTGLADIVQRSGAKALLISDSSVAADVLHQLSLRTQLAGVPVYRLHRGIESLTAASHAQEHSATAVPARAPETTYVPPVRPPQPERLVAPEQPAKPERTPAVQPALMTCPSCQAGEMRRSRVRMHEQLIRRRTAKRPYRCKACHWRGWMLPVQARHFIVDDGPALNLGALDGSPADQRVLEAGR